jgi:hypothetical protein
MDWLICSCMKKSIICISHISLYSRSQNIEAHISMKFIWEKTNLGKESIKTMNFLPFFHKSIELCNSLKRKFIHKVNNIRFR